MDAIQNAITVFWFITTVILALLLLLIGICVRLLNPSPKKAQYRNELGEKGNILFGWPGPGHPYLSGIPEGPARRWESKNYSEAMRESAATGPVPLVVFHQAQK